MSKILKIAWKPPKDVVKEMPNEDIIKNNI
uniref:Uncharacterized protein n=1 Tax=viral metagenome TaxID=1070528 RepID=A0A6C0CE72_9ZZZZ